MASRRFSWAADSSACSSTLILAATGPSTRSSGSSATAARRCSCCTCASRAPPRGRGEPGQFVADRIGHVPPEQPPVDGQGAAQPARAHPDLVHGNSITGPYVVVAVHDHLDLLGQVGAQHVARSALGVQRCRRRSLRRPTDGMVGLGRPGGFVRTGRDQRCGRAEEEFAIPVDEFELPLPPFGQERGATVRAGVRRHVVVAADRQHLLVRAEQAMIDPMRGHRGHRSQLGGAGPGQHAAAQR